MTRSYWPLLLTLSAIWGASYLFIKVAVDEIPPAPMIELRLVIATAILHGFLFATRGFRAVLPELRAVWRVGLLLGVINTAIPFGLIAWGELHIDSGVAAIANASVPIFNALLAVRLLPSERVSGKRLGGILLGLVGVGVLAGVHPEGDSLAVVGTLAVVVASVAYALGGIYGQMRVSRIAGPVLAASSTFWGAIALVPLAAVDPPRHGPSLAAIGSVLGLAILGTALAQLILFRMLRLHGSARVSLVTYLMPPFALAYGALILHERLTPSMLAGLALILGGVAIGSGAVRLPRRAAPAPTP